ncbi:copper homeostasis CutC domain-containing protein [Schizophyllum amplum]|uniref:Copper homeostasis protein cutC homolog n=1 Tax=Schizophyllum amplum TaxID=97359 RepID=A0A550CMM8_9AGAR|nr:copper homeostasis CutC domain-containing protein [Auriculariopsis ampla]
MSTSKTRITLEVCVDSVESALNAVHGGADRIELCGNLGVGGGTTPSLGLLKCVRRAVNGVPIMAMIRPRTGDFLYSEDEMDVMLDDIRIFKRHGARGVVIGVLQRDGTVDVERTKRLVDEALPMQGTFILRPLLLTHPVESGHAPAAPKALPVLARLLQRTSGDTPWALSILPGSGISPATARELLEALVPLGLGELHMSGGSWEDGAMEFRRPDMGMGAGSEWGVWRTQAERVRAVRAIADDFWDASRDEDDNNEEPTGAGPSDEGAGGQEDEQGGAV